MTMITIIKFNIIMIIKMNIKFNMLLLSDRIIFSVMSYMIN